MIAVAFLLWLATAPIADLYAMRSYCIEAGTCDARQLLAVQAEIRKSMLGERSR